MSGFLSESLATLAAFLVVLGAGVLLAAYYMGRQARHAIHLMDTLLTLAQQHEDDPLTFVPNSLEVLEQAGLGYGKVQMSWFGQDVTFEAGSLEVSIRRGCEAEVVGRGEIEAKVMVCPRAGLRGERRVVYTMVRRLWMRLLGSQINGRLAQLHLAEQQLRRYELFYKHDLKNLAQFMHLLSAQLQHSDTDQKALDLVKRLQTLLPALEARAGRILKHLDHKQEAGWQAVDVVSAAELIQAMAQEMSLPVQVEGDAQLAVSVPALERGLQNILENFRHHLAGGVVRVTIEEATHVVRILLTHDGLQGGLDDQHRARMFEPFWTTSESGMGLGLYIARQSIQEACGGRLDAVVLNEQTGQWGFEIRCPRLQADQ